MEKSWLVLDEDKGSSSEVRIRLQTNIHRFKVGKR